MFMRRWHVKQWLISHLLLIGSAFILLHHPLPTIASGLNACLAYFGEQRAVDNGPAGSLLPVLVRYAFEYDNQRTPEDRVAWFGYKNGPNLSPRTVDLSGSKLDQLLDVSKEVSASLPREKMRLSRYDYELLQLRQGDAIRFDGETFVLGEFLGSGNSTHIYALANRRDLVIRLPFLAGRLAWLNTIQGLKTRVIGENEGRLERAYEMSQVTYESLAQVRNDVKADKRYRYLLMPRVQIQKGATDFLQAISLKVNGRPLPPDLLIVKMAQAESRLAEGELALFKSLADLYVRNKYGVYSKVLKEVVFDVVIARQIVLSNEGKWEILDAESKPVEKFEY